MDNQEASLPRLLMILRNGEIKILYVGDLRDYFNKIHASRLGHNKS